METNILLVLVAAGSLGYTLYTQTRPRKGEKHKPEVAEPHDNPSQANAEAQKIREDARMEFAEMRETLKLSEERLLQKETRLDQKAEDISLKESQISEKLKDLESIRTSLGEQNAKALEALEKVSGLSRKEAEGQLLKGLEEDLSQEVGKRIKQAEEEIRESADLKAREILVDVMRYGATDYVPEYTTSIIKLADPDMKGRIIGKEGRNIKAFEQVTGVNVDLDETPGEIRISSFDPVRREIARISLEKLLLDGRIQPAKIEEIVAKTTQDLDQLMYKEGEKLCHSVNVFNLPKEIVSLLGKFKYRYSYGQNMIQHTLEETQLGIKLAKEMGADTNIVRLACLLHDIGKVIDDNEGTHVESGVELLKKYNMPQGVIDCVAQHHEDEAFSSVEAVIVYVVDAISASRPGARHEDYEAYVRRMQDLEAVATGFAGVKKVFAISAGREVRVVVEPEKVDDLTSFKLARDIANKIERDLVYPGQVKVTVVREVRAEEFAR